MKVIADLQIHSRFSRAVSKEMTLPNIAAWAKRKGISLVATGDWTHPMWFREIERDLEEAGNGLLKLKVQSEKLKVTDQNQDSESNTPYFLLATEVSSIFSQGGKGRRVHTLVWVPTVESARKISQEMTKRGCNLLSDGRPIIGLTCVQVAELVFTIEPKALVFPAHAWTPWFSVYGGMSGFDSIEEAFGPFAKYVYAVETGLSSSPAMNWQIKELDHRSIVSFSDAHSGPKLGREATVFEIPEGKVSYDAIYQAIKSSGAVSGDKNLDVSAVPSRNNSLPSISGHSNGSEDPQNFVTSPHQSTSSITQPATYNLQPHISYTIEFHPEEGKYHYAGHRTCNVRYGPQDSKKKGTTCPVCGKPLTQGVMQRIEELAGRSEADLKLIVNREPITQGGPEVALTRSGAFPERPPYVMLVPLQEIIAETIGSPVTSTKTQSQYYQLTGKLGGEFNVLLKSDKEAIAGVAGEKVAAGVEKVRMGDIVIDPGYDGVFGVVKIWKDGEEGDLIDKSKEQLGLF